MYAYQADTWCDPCGRKIKAQLRAEGKEPEEPEDDRTFDSDDFPKWGDEEATDAPQHCAAGEECEDAIDLPGHKIGTLIGSVLTKEGRAYVVECLTEPAADSDPYLIALHALWAETFGIAYRVKFTAYNGISYDLASGLTLAEAREVAEEQIKKAETEGRTVNAIEGERDSWEIEEREDATSIDDSSGFLRVMIED